MDLFLFKANDSAAVYGIGTYLKELIYALKGTDINVHIVHLHAVRSEFVIEKMNQVEHWYIPEARNQNTCSGSVQKLENYCRNVVYLLRLYIKDAEDLVFHFNFNQYYFLAKELKVVFNCKTVTTVHFAKWSFELLGNLSRLHAIKVKPENQRSSYEQLLLTTDKYENFLYKEIDRIIALSQDMKNFLCSEHQLNPDKITIIPSGIKFDVNTQNIVSPKGKWCISDIEYVVLFVGRLQPVKGLLFLIRSFRNVLDIIPNCRLIIAGSGNYDIYLQEAKDICTKVIFTGLLEKKELYELYHKADVGVVPSLYEPFGYVAVEMMMHGLPIVATATSGLNEVVDDSCGLKVPVIEHPDKVEIDTDLLAEKIIYLLQHPVEAREMGKNGRKRYLNKYTSEIFRQNMLEFYRSLFRVC